MSDKTKEELQVENDRLRKFLDVKRDMIQYEAAIRRSQSTIIEFEARIKKEKAHIALHQRAWNQLFALKKDLK